MADSKLTLNSDELRLLSKALEVYYASLKRKYNAESSEAIRSIIALDMTVVDSIRSRSLSLGV